MNTKSLLPLLMALVLGLGTAAQVRSDEEKATLKPGLLGRILAVNSEHGFVVLSVGDKQGVIKDATLLVVREHKLIARLRTTIIEPKTAIADVESGSVREGIKLQPGDVVMSEGTPLDTEPAPSKGGSKPEGGTDKAAPAAANESAARAKAEKIIIPVFDFNELTLDDALDVLRKKAVESDPEKKGVQIIVKPGTMTPTVAGTRITVWQKTIPVIEALRTITGLADLEFAVTPDALVVQPMRGGGGGGGAPASPIPRIPGLDPAPGNAGAEPQK